MFKVKELPPEGGVSYAIINGERCFREIDLAELMFPWERRLGDEHKPNGLAALAARSYRQERPHVVVRNVRKGLSKGGNYLPIGVRDDAIVFHSTEANSLRSRFFAIHTARKRPTPQKEIPVTSITSSPIPAYVEISDLRIPGDMKTPVIAASVPVMAGKALDMAFIPGQVYVAANDFLMLARPVNLTPGRGALDFRDKHPGIIIGLNRPARSKPRFFIPAARLPELLTLALRKNEDRAEADAVVSSVIAAAEAWAVTVRPAPEPEPAVEAEPEPTQEIVTIETSDDEAARKYRFQRAVAEMPDRMASLEARFRVVESAMAPVEVLKEILANQRQIMNDHRTLLDVLGGMARGAMAAVEARS